MSTETQITGKSKHVVQLRKQVARLTGTKQNVLVVGEAGAGKTTVALLIAGKQDVIRIDLAGKTDDGLATLSGLIQGTVVLEGLEDAGFRAQHEVSGYISRLPRGVRMVATLSALPAVLHEQQKISPEICEGLSAFESIRIMPLRERPEDIPYLVKEFASGLAIDINSLETLVKLPWQQNIRQLRSLVDKCLSCAEGGRFTLPEELVDERTEVAKIVGDLMESQRPVLDTSLDLIENSIIRRTLERFGFNESKAAEFLGLTEHAFGQKVKRLALSRVR